MTAYYHTFDTPVGPFSLAVNDAGALIATAFGDLSALRQRVGKMEFQLDSTRCAEAREQVLDYFAGKRQSFALKLAPAGTPFQQSVWKALSAIPFGETRTYGQLATALGSGPRAVGGANGANPIALLVPCHRVIGANGTLTGFAFGNEIKHRLLEHEGVLVA